MLTVIDRQWHEHLRHIKFEKHCIFLSAEVVEVHHPIRSWTEPTFIQLPVAELNWTIATGIIGRAIPEWVVTTVYLVRKNCTFCCCELYCKLNEIIVGDSYSIYTLYSIIRIQIHLQVWRCITLMCWVRLLIRSADWNWNVWSLQDQLHSTWLAIRIQMRAAQAKTCTPLLKKKCTTCLHQYNCVFSWTIWKAQ